MNVTLGEILVRERMITREQLEEALKTQVLFGGRLGTNLVEAEAVTLDQLARALSIQKGVPAAMQSHFEQMSPDAASLLPAKIAIKHQAIPLAVISKAPKILAVAFVNPTLGAVDEVTFAAGCRVKAMIAPEERIHQYLQQLYGVVHKTRFLNLRNDGRGNSVDPLNPHRAPITQDSTILGVIENASAGIEVPMEPEAEMEVVDSGPTPKEFERREQHARLERMRQEQERARIAEALRLQRLKDEHAEQRRRDAERKAQAAAVATQQQRQDMERRARAAAHAEQQRLEAERLARLEQEVEEARQEALRAAEQEQVLELTELEVEGEQPELARPALTATEALRVIAQAASRDDIGDALIDYLRSSFSAGLVLVVRQNAAQGWRGFSAGIGSDTLEGIEVSLVPPSVLRLAFERKAPFRGAPPPEGDEVHQRLWRTLGCSAPTEVLTAPIVVKDRVVVLVLARAFDGGVFPEDALGNVAALCSSAATSFTRLIRAAKPRL